MPKVKEMIQGLSPIARLDEMHPTLAKFSVPAGRELSERHAGSSASVREGGRGGGGDVPTGGLSLSRAFETIEARKAELQARRAWCVVVVCRGIFLFCFDKFTCYSNARTV